MKSKKDMYKDNFCAQCILKFIIANPEKNRQKYLETFILVKSFQRTELITIHTTPQKAGF